MSIEEKDFLDILEQLAIISASTAATVSVVAKLLGRQRKPEQENRPPKEEER